ncbi:MAG: hypothetical protein RMJ85_08970, partial [Anaerolineales bacterium]|nr:hypothetical protein [Anaerolineales bacterium]
MSSSALVQAITIFAALLALFCVWMGIRFIRQGIKITFYRTRQQRIIAGWRWIGVALLMGAIAFVSAQFGETVVNELVFATSTPAATSTSLPTHTAPVTRFPSLTPELTFALTLSATPELPTAILSATSSPGVTLTPTHTRRPTFTPSLTATRVTPPTPTASRTATISPTLPPSLTPT